MLKEGQEAYVAACGDAFEKCDVPVPRIQLHHVVENVGHGLPGQEQIDKFLRAVSVCSNQVAGGDVKVLANKLCGSGQDGRQCEQDTSVRACFKLMDALLKKSHQLLIAGQTVEDECF